MALWYNVIAELAGSHYVMDGWEYSIGGALEVMFSMEWQWRIIRWYNKDVAIRVFNLHSLFESLTHEQTQKLFEELWNIKVYTASGANLTVSQAFHKVLNAAEDLQKRGFECERLLGIAHTLRGIPILSPFYETNLPHQWDTPQYRADYKRYELLAQDTN